MAWTRRRKLRVCRRRTKETEDKVERKEVITISRVDEWERKKEEEAVDAASDDDDDDAKDGNDDERVTRSSWMKKKKRERGRG